MNEITAQVVLPNQIRFGDFIRWALDHMDKLPEIIPLARAVAAAQGIQDKWDAVKPLGDALVPIIADFPTMTPLADVETNFDDYMPLVAEYDAKGFSLTDLLQLWKILRPLIPILLDLLKGAMK